MTIIKQTQTKRGKYAIQLIKDENGLFKLLEFKKGNVDGGFVFSSSFTEVEAISYYEQKIRDAKQDNINFVV